MFNETLPTWKQTGLTLILSYLLETVTVINFTYKNTLVMQKKTVLNLPSLLELCEQSIISSQGKVEGVGLVVVWVWLEVLDDISQKMRSLHSTSWCLIAQLGEMDVEVVVRGLVVQVDSQLTGRKLVLLHYSFLNQNNTGDQIYFVWLFITQKLTKRLFKA